MYTDAINHDPAITFIQTGFQQPGRPSMGAWLSYGLGSENQTLPAFVVLLSQAHAINADQPLFSRLWASGFLPSSYQGVRFRGGSEPGAVSRGSAGRQDHDAAARCSTRVAALNGMKHAALRRSGNRDAHRPVRDGVPDADVGAGPDGSVEGAATRVRACTVRSRASREPTRRTVCWPAAWPSATSASSSSTIAAGTSTKTCRATWPLQCKGTDQPTAALVTDLKQRGLLDDTLVVWGGEFGRTVFSQGKLTDANYGRDHHPRNFCMWLAGGGTKAGLVLGETDDFSYNIVSRSGVRPRPAGDDPAPARHRPHEADLPVPGPRLPADRRARRGGEVDSSPDPRRAGT